MAVDETTSHSFIVKVWVEEAPESSEPVVWRGHITHVPSGERRYVQALSGIAAFIAPYLQELGAEVEGQQSVE